MKTPTLLRRSKQYRQFGQRVALRSRNPYRAKAYVRAAETLDTLTVPLAQQT
jgi:hypothetical protein